MSQLGDATGVQWVETRDAAKHPTMCRAVPTTRDDLAIQVSLMLVVLMEREPLFRLHAPNRLLSSPDFSSRWSY